MLSLLIRVQLVGTWKRMFGRMTSSAKKRGAGKKILIALLAVYVIGALAFSLGMMFQTIAGQLVAAGLHWFYFALVASLATGVCFMFNVFAAQSQLFDATDNELLLSLPIRPRTILASRMLALLINEYAFAFIIFTPAVVMYTLATPVGASFWLMAVPAFLLLPCIAFALSCACGYLLALVMSKTRSKTLVQYVLMVVFIGLYLYVYTGLNRHIQTLIMNGAQIANVFKTAVPPMYYFGRMITGGAPSDALLAALWFVGPVAAVWLVLARHFASIMTARKGAARVVYREKPMRARTAGVTLLSREFRRLVMTPIYLFNCGLGGLLALAFGVYAFFQGDAFIAPLLSEFGISDIGGFLAPGLVAILCFCTVMANTACVSISIEGRRLWILKSLPVSTKDLFLSKICFSFLTFAVPFLPGAACLIAVVPMAPADIALLFAVPLVMQLFVSLSGLAVNLMLPRLDWVSEAAVVKRSGSAVVASLATMGMIMLFALLYALWLHKHLSAVLYLTLCAAVLATASAGLYGFLMSKGKRIFEAL